MSRTKDATKTNDLPVDIEAHEEILSDKIVDPVVDPVVETDGAVEGDEDDSDELELDEDTLDPFGDKWES